MSTTVKIIGVRGTTTYEFFIEEMSQEEAERRAASSEKWINEQPDRLALNDTQSRSTR